MSTEAITRTPSFWTRSRAYAGLALFALAVVAVVAGQFALAVQKNADVAFSLYAVGAVSFALLLVMRGASPLGAGAGPWGTSWRSPLPAFVFGLFAFSLLTVDVPGQATNSLIAWAVGLLLALFVAVPSQARAGWISLESFAPFASSWRLLRGPWRSHEVAGVSALALTGAFLRLYDLAGVPGEIHGDEAAEALIALSIVQGNGPNPFGTAFLGDPALAFWLEAPLLALFGPNIVAARLFAALWGVATLPLFYLLMRRLFGVRPALFALAMLAGSAVHINYSRLGLNVNQIPALYCAALLALFQARRTRNPAWWLLTGVLSGLATYFAFGGLLLPPLIAFAYLAFALRERDELWDWLDGARLMLLGGLMTLAPRIVHQFGRPDLYTWHISGRFVFSPDNFRQLAEKYQTTSPAEVFWEQLRINLLAFISRGDVGPFYSFAGAPMIAAVLAPFAVLGCILLLVRGNDPRYATLFFWFWSVVILGGALTVDSPHTHRILPALLPALGGSALALHWLIRYGVHLIGRQSRSGFLLIGCLVLTAAAYADASLYFGKAVSVAPWAATTRQARYIAGLGPDWHAYSLGVPSVYFRHETTRFLAPDVRGGDLANPLARVPLPGPADHDLALLVYSHMRDYLPFLMGYYPDASLDEQRAPNGNLLFSALRVPRDRLPLRPGLMARYAGSERIEGDPSNLGGGAASYPTEATWTGSLYVDRPNRYQILASDRDARLSVDGLPLQPTEVRPLAGGWHAITVQSRLAGPRSRLSLSWRVPGGQPAPIPPASVDAQSLAGNVRVHLVDKDGQSYAGLAKSIGARQLRDLFQAKLPAMVSWEGTLDVGCPGPHAFILSATGLSELSVDGQRIAATSDQRVLQRAEASADLAEGSHTIQLRYEWSRDDGLADLAWRTPCAAQSSIPPAAFTPLPDDSAAR